MDRMSVQKFMLQCLELRKKLSWEKASTESEYS